MAVLHTDNGQSEQKYHQKNEGHFRWPLGAICK